MLNFLQLHIFVTVVETGGFIALSALMPQWLVNDMYTRKQLIVAGMGIGRLPQHLIEQELKTGELIILDQQYYASVTMEMYAMRLKNSEHGKISNHLWRELAKTV